MSEKTHIKDYCIGQMSNLQKSNFIHLQLLN